MAFVRVQSVLKGFHATNASLVIGRGYKMQRVRSRHDRNAFFVVDRGIFKASMPRELSKIIAPCWDNGKVVCIVCYPTGQIRVSEKGLMQLGGGLDMPCIFYFKCMEDDFVRTLVVNIPNSHLRKKHASPEISANKIEITHSANILMPSSSSSVGKEEEGKEEEDKEEEDKEEEDKEEEDELQNEDSNEDNTASDHDNWFPQSLEMNLFDDFDECSSSTSSPLKGNIEKEEEDHFVPSSVTPPGSALAEGGHSAIFSFPELNSAK